MENGRRRVFYFAMLSFNMSLHNDKLDYLFKKLNCAAKINLAFRIILKNIEDGLCRSFYAPENKTIMDRSKLVCAQAYMTILKDRRQKMEIVHICTRDRIHTKWKIYKLTNLPVFVLLLKDIPMGCNDTVSHEPLLKNHNVDCFTFERNTKQPYNDNLCLFRALALHLHGDEKLEEETSKTLNFFPKHSEEGDVSKFQNVHLNDLPKAEDLLQLNVFLYDVNFVDGEPIGEFCRVFKSMKKILTFYAIIITFATSTTSTHWSRRTGVLHVTNFSQRRGIWNDTCLLVVIVLNIFSQKVFTI